MNPLPLTALLRPAVRASSSRLPSLPLSLSPSPLASTSSQSSSFSTTPIALASRERRMRAKAKRNRNIALQAAKAADIDTDSVDFVLGYVPRPGVQSQWEGCRLQRVLLRPEAIYSAPETDYSAHEQPKHYLPGLSGEDKEMLFGALPYTSTALKIRRLIPSAASGSFGSLNAATHAKITETEENKVEQMQRMLDLRNANKKGIEVVNRQRVIEEFGGAREPGQGENTGSSEVQAALLTQRIRSVAEHLVSNRKDNSNRRALRNLIHQRQQVLKYFARKNPAESYDKLLSDLGLERRAVEGEITL